MCGRYYRSSDKQRISEAFHTTEPPDSLVIGSDYNVAPTTTQPVIRLNRDTGEREIVMMRWGLIPYFVRAAEDYRGFSIFNAKAETVADRSIWRGPFEKRRCLVPADGFYEWKKLNPKHKEPYAFGLKNGEPFAFAGLWDGWKDPATGEWLQTFAIITTTRTRSPAPFTTACP